MGMYGVTKMGKVRNNMIKRNKEGTGDIKEDVSKKTTVV